MTVVSKTRERLIRVLAISAATVMIAACASGPTEPRVDPAGAQTSSPTENDLISRPIRDVIAEEAIYVTEDVAVTATATPTGTEQWLLDATVTRRDDRSPIFGFEISWDLPGGAQVTGFDGACTPMADRQTCLTSKIFWGGSNDAPNTELLVSLPTSPTDRAVIVTVTHQFDRYDIDPVNNTTTIELE